ILQTVFRSLRLIPQPGDWAIFNFTPPIRLDGFTLRSGNAEHPDDMFYNTSVELAPANRIAGGAELTRQNYPITDDGFYVVGWFSPTGLVQMENFSLTTPIASLRLVVHAESVNWESNFEANLNISHTWTTKCQKIKFTEDVRKKKKIRRATENLEISNQQERLFFRS
uniref:MGAT4 A/B/C C-terminal domain-containing protein n=1 Tax=Romanomermis culicivorax TaxID=13658 RepID=A0A915KRH1_ROMCU